MPEQRPDGGLPGHSDTEQPSTADGAEGQSRYRSLRDLSSGPRGAAPGAPPAASPWGRPEHPRPAGGHPEPQRPDDPAQRPVSWTAEPPARRDGLRSTVIGAVAAIFVVVLAWGGYMGYRQFAPYYGLGYTAGGTGTVQEVTFTVTEAQCGLADSPSTRATPVRGQFCVVKVRAVNNADKTRYLSLSMFSVELDTGSRANPARTAMVQLSTKLAPGESKNLELVYDVWDGVRMDTLKVQIGYQTAKISLI